MMLIEETSVPDAALPVAEFKAHLRLGTGFSDHAVQDAVLTSFLRAAMAAIEGRTGKILLSRDFAWTLTRWRHPVQQVLPVAPVTDLVELVITDAAGNETTIDASSYRLERDHHAPRLCAAGGVLPAIPAGGTADISFRAGYAIAFGDLPADLAQAVFMLAGHYYEHRAETGRDEGAMPYGVSVLLERYRPLRLGTGGGLA
ncbi:MAG: head-tail connector protein [Pseudomonadota bacterium]